MEETLGRSHDFCQWELGPKGCESLSSLTIEGWQNPQRERGGRMVKVSSLLPANEAKYVDGAR